MHRHTDRSRHDPDPTAAAEQATVSVHQVDDGVTLLRLVGDIDAAATAAAMPTFLRLSSAPPQKLCVDASRVTFLDSTGIGALAMVAVAVRQHGGELTTNVSQVARRVLVLCGLEHLFALAPDTIGQHLLQDRLERIRNDQIG
jgi:anti-sigma B factor antagonist